MSTFSKLIEKQLKAIVTDRTELAEVDGEVRALTPHKMVLPVIKTAIEILLHQHGEGAFLRNSAKALSMGFSAKEAKLNFTFAKPIPWQILTTTSKIQIPGCALLTTHAPFLKV